MWKLLFSLRTGTAIIEKIWRRKKAKIDKAKTPKWDFFISLVCMKLNQNQSWLVYSRIVSEESPKEENGSSEKKAETRQTQNWGIDRWLNQKKKQKRSESKVEELSCGGKEPGSRSLSLSHPSRQSLCVLSFWNDFFVFFQQKIIQLKKNNPGKKNKSLAQAHPQRNMPIVLFVRCLFSDEGEDHKENDDGHDDEDSYIWWGGWGRR